MIKMERKYVQMDLNDHIMIQCLTNVWEQKPWSSNLANVFPKIKIYLVLICHKCLMIFESFSILHTPQFFRYLTELRIQNNPIINNKRLCMNNKYCVVL